MNNFLGTSDSDSNLQNGTEDLFINSLKVNNLTANLPLKVDGDKDVYSTLLNISDVSGLQSALDDTISTPHIGTIEATDFKTQNISSVDRSIEALQLAGDDAVYKSVPTTQVLSGDLNLPSSIGNVNVGAELGLVITQANGNTANILTLQNDTVSKTEPATQVLTGDIQIPMGETSALIGQNLYDLNSTSTELLNKTVNIDNSTFTDYTKLNGVLDVGGNLKLNANILDSADKQSYILKKSGGVGSYNMGLSSFTGSGANNLVMGNNVGNTNHTGISNVIIGVNAGTDALLTSNNVIIGSGTGAGVRASGNTIIGAGIVGVGLNNSTSIGNNAGAGASGTRCVYIGGFSGQSVTGGSDNVFIGTNTSGVSGGSQICIGSGASTTGPSQCVIGGTALLKFQSNGFRDLDVRTDNILAIGKTLASAVEIGKVGANTTIKGNLTVPSINTLTAVGGKFSQYGVTSISNTTDEIPLIGAGVGNLIFPASSFALGDTYKITIGSAIASTGIPNILFVFKFNGATIISAVVETNNNIPNTPLLIDVQFNITGLGTNGTLFIHGRSFLGSTFVAFPLNIATFDTTVANTLEITAKWFTADAGNTLTTSNVNVFRVY